MNITRKTILRFKNSLISEEKSPATIEKYLRDAGGFALFAGGREPTKETVLAYKKLLISRYSARSVNSMLAGINKFLSFIGKDEIKVKAVRLQKSAFCSEEKELTKSEYLRLCSAAEKRKNTRLSLILQAVSGTGIRISELKYITVEAARRGEATVSCKGKTRTIFIVKELRKKLLSYAVSNGIKSGTIFITRSGKPIDRTSVWREMKSICTQANVLPQKVFPHNLRRLFARTFYFLEKDIVKLADILGHSSVNTTRIYIISTGTEHRRRMEKMRMIL